MTPFLYAHARIRNIVAYSDMRAAQRVREEIFPARLYSSSDDMPPTEREGALPFFGRRQNEP